MFYIKCFSYQTKVCSVNSDPRQLKDVLIVHEWSPHCKRNSRINDTFQNCYIVKLLQQVAGFQGEKCTRTLKLKFTLPLLASSKY